MGLQINHRFHQSLYCSPWRYGDGTPGSFHIQTIFVLRTGLVRLFSFASFDFIKHTGWQGQVEIDARRSDAGMVRCYL